MPCGREFPPWAERIYRFAVANLSQSDNEFHGDAVSEFQNRRFWVKDTKIKAE